MVQRTSTMIAHATMMTAKKNTMIQVKRTQNDDFILFAIETYECFHFHFDSFFTTYAQTIITCHQQSFLIFFNACLILLIIHIHNPIMYINHYDYSTSYYTWSGFLISFVHHN
jgi:ABC-type transport system involved in cytochrome bd biosynthesis fused ATPase/permease subunit